MPIRPAHLSSAPSAPSVPSVPLPGGTLESSFRSGPTIPLAVASRVHAQLRYEMLWLALAFQWPSIVT